MSGEDVEGRLWNIDCGETLEALLAKNVLALAHIIPELLGEESYLNVRSIEVNFRQIILLVWFPFLVRHWDVRDSSVSLAFVFLLLL